MAKYLFKAAYTAAGAKGLASEGGVSRKKRVTEMLEAIGGRMDAFYYAFGETDVYAIGELPDNVSAAAASLAINASGAVTLSVVPLISPEEMDRAAKMQPSYKPPGG
jgi:uncharacterized protein with GYD domain